ncbi:histidine kinase [Winogradskyella maritima]|nr:histidine kinase [Winogradskyella maritima]
MSADKGLFRYNGREYKHFTHPKQRGNAVFGVLEDTQGRVWCTNISGQFFYVENDRMHLFLDLSDKLRGLISEFLVSDNILYVLSAQKLFKIPIKTSEITLLKNNRGFIGSYSQHNRGYVYSSFNMLYFTDKEFVIQDSLKLDMIKSFDEESGIIRRINTFHDDETSFIYFLKFGKNTFYSTDFENQSISAIEIPERLEQTLITHISKYHDQFWISTDNGLFVCELQSNNLRIVNHWYNKIFVTKTILDKQDNFWISTKGNGIYLIPNIGIYHYPMSESLENITELESIDSNEILFGTNTGYLSKYNIKYHKSAIIDSSGANRVSKIVKAQFDKDFIVAKEDKTFLYKSNAEELLEISSDFNGAKDISVVNGGYLISLYNGVKLVDLNYNLEESLGETRSYANCYNLEENSIYVASVNGLMFKPDGAELKEIFSDGKKMYIKVLDISTENEVWAGSFKSGIYKLKNGNVVKHITKRDGLLSNIITEIKCDDKGLWIVTDLGLQYYDFLTKTFKSITKQDGMPTYRIADILPIGDYIYMASNNGMFRLDKSTVFKPRKTADIYIANIKVDSEIKTLKSHYNLDYDENAIEITLNVNGFQTSENLKYQYRLIGLGNKWQTLRGSDPQINYNSLPSGNFKFETRTITSSGEIGEPINLTFKIARPFWSTWWFYVLIILTVGFLAYLFFRRKINVLKQRQVEALQQEMVSKQLVLSQLENLRSQMNPHFIFNALNSIQEYIVMNEKDLASTYLIKFSRLIRIYLDHSRENEVVLSEEIKALKIYLELEKNRFEDALDYSIHVSDNLSTSDIQIPSLFIQPYVENALKHGLLHKNTNRELDISFNLDRLETKLFCTIKDNGIGVEASKELNKGRRPQHRSFATSANEKRVKLINQNRNEKIKVTVNSNSDIDNDYCGTEVIITIPLKSYRYEGFNH